MALVPTAKADPTVTAQENQAKQLQKELKRSRSRATRWQPNSNPGRRRSSSSRPRSERQQAALNQQAADLQRQQDALQSQQASLEAQQASLESQATQLQNQKTQLEAEAKALAARAKADARHLIASRGRDPAGRARDHDNHRSGSARPPPGPAGAAPGRRGGDHRRPQAEREGGQGARGPGAQAEATGRSARGPESRSSRPRAPSSSLRQRRSSPRPQCSSKQGDALQKQGDSLQAQADALQQQKDDLDALQAKAAKQQKQATQLQNELTKTLTKAGGDDRGTDPRLVDLQDALINTKGDELVAPPQISKRGDDVVLHRDRNDRALGHATADLVRLLRDKVIPNHSEKGVTAFVGGSTAGNVDLASEIASRLPLVIITILLLSMLVLLVAFRSLLIPLQAAVTNFLTAMAAFGIVTAVFQWGWGISLVGIDTTASTVPIASFVPLMMFAVLFGLSMDYQVFLLSSVDHFRAHGESDHRSVRLGLKASARVIAAAALIMMSVFSSFVLNGDPVVKQFGVGLASAVALAATMVLMLAPAVLTVMGKWAWWMPSLLGKIVPKVDIEGTSLTEPEPAAPAAGE